MSATHERRLAAIMIADVAGFSRLMELAESQTFERVRRMREEITNPTVEKSGGRIIKTTGDGFLAEFVSAIAALRCGIEIQRKLIALEADQPVETRIRLRIGINVGDIIIDGTDIAGDGVNIAARLESMAPVDGICISSMVHDQIRDDLGVVFQDLGQQQLKNIARPVRAFTVNVGGRVVEEYAGTTPAGAAGKRTAAKFPGGVTAATTKWRRSRVKPVSMAIAGLATAAFVLAGIVWYTHTSQIDRGGPSLAKNDTSAAQHAALSIMVLPFANQTGDPQKAYIADALTSSITSDLSRIRDAFVIPVGTAFTYKEKPATMQQLGQDVGVRFVLQGSVLASGEKIRISAQLADTQSGAQLWSEIFDGELSNLFALQDQVTTRIGNSIGREMVIVAARESETRSSSPQVSDLMLRARALRLKPSSSSNFRQVEVWYRQAVALEPNNARAMAGLANSLVAQSTVFGFELDENAQKKKLAEGHDLALQAKQLDPDIPEIYWALGFYAAAYHDYPAWRRAEETWLALEPKNPDAYNNLAYFFIENVQPEKAKELMTQAINLDPKHPSSGLLLDMGTACFMLGENDEAIEWLLKTLERNPEYTDAYVWLAVAYTNKGDDARARAAVADLRRARPNFSLRHFTSGELSTPGAVKDWYESKFLPPARKAGLPE